MSGARLAVTVFAASLAALLTALGAAGSTAPAATKPDPALARFYTQKLVWRACGQGFECAKATVPVDYANPAGPTLRLALKRIRGASSAKKTLFINPGGPGFPGTGELTEDLGTSTIGATLESALGKQYSVVGFDPRGVGASSPLDCRTGVQLDAWFQRPVAASSAAARAALTSRVRAFAHGCQRHAGLLAAHVSTVEVAKDLDVLRALVGDSKLSYLGSSYGTRIGAVYAQLFPKLVGRMVLDGAERPKFSVLETNRAQAVGTQLALKSFVANCVAMSDCPLGTSVSGGMQKLAALVDRLATKPLSSGDPKRPLTDLRAVFGIVAPLYSPDDWGELRSALRSVFGARDGRRLAELADLYVARRKSGYQANGNLVEANQAITCLDDVSREGIGAAANAAPTFRRIAPVTGEFEAWDTATCGLWPIKATNPQPTINPVGVAPVLVVGTTRDFATPYPDAVALTKALKTATLLTYVGDGHLAYLRSYPCIDRWVNRYLLTGKTPPHGARCSG